MKLVIFGGGSQNTPSLFMCEEIVRNLDALDVLLIGRNTTKLSAVRRAIETLTEPARVHISTRRLEPGALAGADLILIQARYGGYEAQAHDERFPLEFGVPGDVALGPGGLASAWRSWPSLRELLAQAQREALHSQILLLASPLGLLTRCAFAAFPALQLAGLCELPWTTLHDVCADADVNVFDASYDYAGVSHAGWFDRIEAGGRNVISAYTSSRSSTHFPKRALLERLGAVPLKYLRLHYDRTAVLTEQLDSPPRPLELANVQEEAILAFTDGDREAILSALALRPAPCYAYAVAPWISGAIEGVTNVPLFLTTRNDGYIASLASDDVLEIPHTCVVGRLRRNERRRALKPNVQIELERLVLYERAAYRAVLERSPQGAVDALTLHPWVTSRNVAKALAEAVYEGQRTSA